MDVARGAVVRTLVALAVVVACGRSDNRMPSGARSLDRTLLSAAPLSIDSTTAPLIGGLRANPDDEFNHRNGFLSGRSLSDGSFAVIDEFRLRIFSPSGVQRAVYAKSGRGPGEALLFSALCVTRGDTIIVFDEHNRRVNVFDREAGLVRQFVSEGARKLLAQGCMGDGTFVVAALDKSADGVLGGEMSRHSTTGDLVQSLGSFPQYAPTVTVSHAASGSAIWTADPRTQMLTRLDIAGGPRFSLRLLDEPRTLSVSEIENRQPVASVRGSSQSPQATERPGSDVAPFCERAVLSRDGARLWLMLPVADFREPSRWVAVDTSGAVRGMLEIPGFSGRGMPPIPVEFSANFVWLLRRDADGVATFAIHRLSGLE